ncbi:hypothetical protein Mal52_07920 [Symmachiella dynata]|uniref:Uncharacterized protein n=1 Tax=Symmachiella dynata TaxID=2527995 RepID=A0A517ZIP4_9PLAN|nr:hypothetical protein Mal52_07920 [Symmachiella dynata]
MLCMTMLMNLQHGARFVMHSMTYAVVETSNAAASCTSFSA